MRAVRIVPVLNGFMVEVGCQTLCFNDIHTLCRELKRYQKKPAEVEKEYMREAVNKPDSHPEVAPPASGLSMLSLDAHIEPSRR